MLLVETPNKLNLWLRGHFLPRRTVRSQIMACSNCFQMFRTQAEVAPKLLGLWWTSRTLAANRTKIVSEIGFDNVSGLPFSNLLMHYLLSMDNKERFHSCQTCITMSSCDKIDFISRRNVNSARGFHHTTKFPFCYFAVFLWHPAVI